MSTGNLTLTAAGTPTDLANRLGAGVKCVLGREEIAAIRSLAWLVMLVESNPFAGFDVNVGLEVAFLRRDASLSTHFDSGTRKEPCRRESGNASCSPPALLKAVSVPT
jgi:uncharacterized protein (DUF1697 family)